ncbi:PepSY domain-containing protein [Acuticoccus yangtzensis]|uniref:PepSY domain-containing protein n=1 Tax=Acuticoccus yangtzensis TaxID=1443441 RepID=UPI0009497808|nr:PepSY domain-containing protein [Acuticoccus yangtzensis]
MTQLRPLLPALIAAAFSAALAAATATAASAQVQSAPPRPAVLDQMGFAAEGERMDDDDMEAWGRLKDGTRVEVTYDQGGLEDIEVRGGMHATLPLTLIDLFVEDATGRYPELSHFTRLTEVGIDDDGGLEIEGYAVDGHELEAEFDRTGTLRRFNRD